MDHLLSAFYLRTELGSSSEVSMQVAKTQKGPNSRCSFLLSQAHGSYFEIKQQNLGRPLGKGPSLYKAWHPVGSLGIPEMCMASFVEPY